MPGYLTRQMTVRIGGRDYLMRALSDLQQFHDPLGDTEQAGISSALWSLFGQIWPAGRVLAGLMAVHDVAGKRILAAGALI